MLYEYEDLKDEYKLIDDPFAIDNDFELGYFTTRSKYSIASTVPYYNIKCLAINEKLEGYALISEKEESDWLTKKYSDVYEAIRVIQEYVPNENDIFEVMDETRLNWLPTGYISMGKIKLLLFTYFTMYPDVEFDCDENGIIDFRRSPLWDQAIVLCYSDESGKRKYKSYNNMDDSYDKYDEETGICYMNDMERIDFSLTIKTKIAQYIWDNREKYFKPLDIEPRKDSIMSHKTKYLAYEIDAKGRTVVYGQYKDSDDIFILNDYNVNEISLENDWLRNNDLYSNARCFRYDEPITWIKQLMCLIRSGKEDE